MFGASLLDPGCPHPHSISFDETGTTDIPSEAAGAGKQELWTSATRFCPSSALKWASGSFGLCESVSSSALLIKCRSILLSDD